MLLLKPLVLKMETDHEMVFSCATRLDAAGKVAVC